MRAASCLVLVLLSIWTPPSRQTSLSDLLSTADRFFEEFQPESRLDVDDIKSMIKRSLELREETRVRTRRSADDFEPLVKDIKGVFLLSNIADAAKIPAKFPNDINTVSFHNVLFIATLEANGTNPEVQLANDLVLYQYSPHGIEEIGRVSVIGGIKTAIHVFQNNVYIIVAEHEVRQNPEYFEGSTVYKLIYNRGRILLEKVQIINVIQPNDVQFWEHQNEFYLAIGSNMGNDTQRTGTLIYRWMGAHFDCIQRIPGKYVKSVVPFTMGSFMYLAVANYQDEYGNTDILSDIYQFHLEDLKFHHFQSLKTHGAQNLVHFQFDGTDEGGRGNSEHFLAVANYIGKSSSGALTSFLDSVVYKFNGQLFVPFQSFRLLGASRWLPIKGPGSEFLLMVVYSNGVKGYQYDGWRFSHVSLKYGQSTPGSNVQSVRAFHYFGNVFLTIADKNSYGDSVNMWKLSFTNKNELEEAYAEVEVWCERMTEKIAGDNVTSAIKYLKSGTGNIPEALKLESQNLRVDMPPESLRNQVDGLMKEVNELNVGLENLEGILENRKDEEEIPIVLGSREIPNLEIKCSTRNCVTFKNLDVTNLNGEDFAEFLSNVVSTEKDITDYDLEFEHLVVRDNLLSAFVNGHPVGTIIDGTSDTFINSDLVVNGTVFINDELNVDGLFDGVIADRESLLLYEGDQVINGKLVVDTLKVDNLKLSGLINRQLIEDLLRRPEIELQNSYKELKVNNIVVDGLVGGYNVTELFEHGLKHSGNQTIQGRLDVITLQADEVLIESQTDLPDFILANPCLLQSVSDEEDEDDDRKRRSTREPLHKGKKGSENLGEKNIIVVEGLLRARDIIDSTETASLLSVVTNSYRLNESVVESHFEFTDVVVNELHANIINNVTVNSWVDKDSTEVQHISGRKEFADDIHVLEEVSAGTINGVDLKELSESALTLKGDQDVPGNWTFAAVTCDELSANFSHFGQQLQKLDRLVVTGSAVIEALEVDSLQVLGKIDNLSWEDVLRDSVFSSDDLVTGEKVVEGTLRVGDLTVSGVINDDDLPVSPTTEQVGGNGTVVLYGNVRLDNSLNVSELEFEGMIDTILRPTFAQDWLIQDEDQVISVPFTFENLDLKSGSSLKNETVNNVNLRKIFTRSIKINEDTRFRHLYAIDKIKVGRIDVGGTLNGADFGTSVLRQTSPEAQHLLGHWFFEDGLNIDGSLIIDGFTSGLNISHLCSLKAPEKINLVVGGSVRFKTEPKIDVTVNGVDIAEKTKQFWMKNENTTLTGSNLRFDDVGFDSKTTLSGLLNSYNLTQISKFYLSKTLNRVVSEDFDLGNLVIEKWCRMRKAEVGGRMNDIDIDEWSKKVLLQDADQVVEARLRFNVFEAENELTLNGTINGLDLSRDVLRYDVEDFLVEGEKTFEGFNVVNLSMSEGTRIQGVNVDAWRANMVPRTGDILIQGNLRFKSVDLNGPVAVLGQVNGLHFDSEHLLTTEGDQVVTASKYFNLTDETLPMRINSLEVSGEIDGLDLNHLMKNQAYLGRDLIFTRAQTFTRGLDAGAVEVDGLFQGVNITEMCQHVLHPTDIDNMETDFDGLVNKTRDLIEVVKGRAFFFDYFELIQTLKPSVKAVVPTISGRDHSLAVFSPTTMKLMNWNEYSENFLNTDERLDLNDNINFVTSEIGESGSLLYIESFQSTKIFLSDSLQEIEARDTSCVTSFTLKALNSSCLFVGQKRNSSRILCSGPITNELRTYQWLESKGSVRATALTIGDDVYLAVINKEEVVDKVENSLTIYRFDSKLHHFYETHTLAEVNPVAVSSITYKGHHYLVSAGGHLPESVHNSVITIFRYNANHKVFTRFKSILVDTPVDVQFALLPSTELALYVLTSNPTKPFIVYLYRGIAGFVEETSGLSLYPGTNLYSFTDFKNRHFVVISGFDRGQILKAGFKGGQKGD